jgi:hypothetical protein
MPTKTAVAGFDYGILDRETADFLQQQTGEIRALMRRSAQDIFEIGEKLIEIKQRLGHGRFGNWLAAEFAWTDRLAQQFMNVARQFRSENISDLQLAPTALYLLAAPSTPEVVREEALARARAGEPITHKQVKELKKHHAPPSPDLKEAGGRGQEAGGKSTTFMLGGALAAPPVGTDNGGAAATARKPLEVVALRRAADQSWSQLGEHRLFWGHPNSTDFQSRLPADIALWLAFPPQRGDWQSSLLPSTKAALSFYLDWDSQLPLEPEDFSWMVTLLDTHLKLYSKEEGENLVLAFLPTPQLLLVAHAWGCRCFLAEPDPQRCQAVLAAWTEKAKEPALAAT